MFEKEIKFIYDFSINEVRRLGSFFSYEELSSADLHPAILKYISAELDYLIYEDRQKLLSNSNFDYSGSKIAEYFSLIGEEIKKSKRFSFEYVDNLILHAISFNVNFLAQPKWALTKLIFEKEDVIKTAELRQIINYVYFHDYIKAIIEKYLLKKNLQMISRAEFESILDKLDQELLGTDPSKVFNLVLRAIGEFFNIGSVIKSKIPLYPFKLYLKEKKFQGYVAKLDNSFRGDTRQTFDIVEVQNVLFPQEVKKQPEQKPPARKTAHQKPEEKRTEKKPVELKSVEQKPSGLKLPEQKPLEKKPEGPKPLVPNFVPNGENYLDRIVRQETPASFFGFGRTRETAPENEAPVSDKKESETPVNEAPEASAPEVESLKNEKADTSDPAEKTEIAEETSSGTESAEQDKDPDFESLLNEEPESPQSAAPSEEESIILEFPEDEKRPEELEFVEVKEPDNGAEFASLEVMDEEKPEVKTEVKTEDTAEDETEEKTEEIFDGINIDTIDLDVIDKDEPEETGEVENGKSGLFSRILKKGSRNAKKTDRAEIIAPEEPLISFDGEITLEAAPEEIEEVENVAADNAIEGGNTFSKVFAVISEVFSKREQQKIISEIFANRPEKFAATVYNVITEARDGYDAERLIDLFLKSNKIDLSSKWARVFKKNIKQYFNQD